MPQWFRDSFKDLIAPAVVSLAFAACCWVFVEMYQWQVRSDERLQRLEAAVAGLKQTDDVIRPLREALMAEVARRSVDVMRGVPDE